MFKKILIANRGEIAVRIIRACREMDIRTVALYEKSDRDSLHVRLADVCVEIPSQNSFMEQDTILSIALEQGVDAVHPGYGFLAEDPTFIKACAAAGVVFIGPPAEVVDAVRTKIGALETARAADVRTVYHSPRSYSEEEYDELAAQAAEIGYPLVIKSCRGGRGRGERMVNGPEHLAEAVRRSQVESQSVYRNKQVYLERVILPAHQVGVQIIADQYGNVIHLGEREGSIIQSNQKIVEEAPALCLTPEGRQALLETAVRLARLFHYQNLGTVEFLVDDTGDFYFSEIKARIQIEHTLTEIMTRIDLIREQIRLATGEPLGFGQEDIHFNGWAMMCRIQAEDPSRHFMPSPGHLRRVLLPAGPEVRVDTYLHSDSEIPPFYDPLIAKATVWASDRPACINRMRRALEDFTIIGTPTNLPLLLQIMRAPAFITGEYTTDLLQKSLDEAAMPDIEGIRRDLAAAVAVLYVRRREAFDPRVPDRMITGWHRTSRHIQ